MFKLLIARFLRQDNVITGCQSVIISNDMNDVSQCIECSNGHDSSCCLVGG